jgi:hypothetical protein
VKLVVRRYSLQIIPESPIDEAYLEECLGLTHSGDTVLLRRVNAGGLSCWAYAETETAKTTKTEA